MEEYKRVVLVGKVDTALQTVFEEQVSKFARTYLDIYPDCEGFAKLIGKQNAFTNSIDHSLLIIINASSKTALVQSLLNEIRLCGMFSTIPIVLMLQEPEEDFIKQCYQQHVSAIVILPENREDLPANIERVLGFWLNTVTLPKNILGNASKNPKFSSDIQKQFNN